MIHNEIISQFEYNGNDWQWKDPFNSSGVYNPVRYNIIILQRFTMAMTMKQPCKSWWNHISLLQYNIIILQWFTMAMIKESM